eukprot:UN05286
MYPSHTYFDTSDKGVTFKKKNARFKMIVTFYNRACTTAFARIEAREFAVFMIIL